MRILYEVAKEFPGVGDHIYVVGGAVRNHLLGVPVKDIDVVVDSIALEGKDSDWFAKRVCEAIPVATSMATNQYGVAIISIKEDWLLDGISMFGEVIEIANARKESYDGAGKGKGYKPTDVKPATIQEDIYRREFTFNTLLWRLSDLVDGPDKAEIVDFTGLGVAHLKEKLIQTPLDPDRTFSDDPTRMLRAIKFVVKYELNISPEVAASISKNAEKLKNMPWEAVGNLLVRDILSTPNARNALVTMGHFGLIAVLSDMIRTEKPFASFMAGQFQSENNVGLLLDMVDLGLVKSLNFLSEAQRARLRFVTNTMTPGEATTYLAVVRKPIINNEGLISEYNLQGRDRQDIVKFAREALLRDPQMLPEEVEVSVRKDLNSAHPLCMS